MDNASLLVDVLLASIALLGTLLSIVVIRSDHHTWYYRSNVERVCPVCSRVEETSPYRVGWSVRVAGDKHQHD